ncbi:MAG: glycosyltransferase family 1 protein, partial [Candidatus Latescibacterota bacterium]
DKNVLFLGFTDRIFEYLSILDIFVLSSLTEGLPMVLLEAMYAGCPVVCSRVGGIPEVIDDETSGFCIEPNNPQILSEKLLALLKDPSLGKRVARNARIKVKKSFSSDSMAVKYIELYNELLAKKE